MTERVELPIIFVSEKPKTEQKTKTKTSTPEKEELRQLKERKKELDEQLNIIKGKPKLTPKQKLQEIIKKREEQIADFEKSKREKAAQKIITKKEIFDKVNKNIGKGTQALQNPQQILGYDTLLGFLGRAGPIGLAITAIVTAIIMAPEMLEKIIKALSTKGMPLNRDYHRSIETEVNGLLDTEEKKRRLLGLDPFIVTQNNVYQPESGSTTFNSLENRDEIIISKIGLAEHAVGIVDDS